MKFLVKLVKGELWDGSSKSLATTVSQGCGKNNQKKINQLPTSQGLSVKKKEQSHQTVQSEELAQQR